MLRQQGNFRLQLVLLWLSYLVSANSLSLDLEHAFHAGQFSKCGKLESPPREPREGPPHLEIKRASFSAEQRAAFERLVADDGFYRLRVQPSEGPAIMASIRAKCLAGSGLQEAFEAHLDVNGHLVALSWSTPPGSCSAQSTGLPHGWQFAEVQRVPTRMPAKGPSLHPNRPAFSDPGQAMSGPSFLGEQPSDAKAAAGGGPKGKVILGKDGKPIPEPEKTWMQKNWLIIMIGAAVVLNIISNSSGAGPAQGQGRAATNAR